MDEREEGRRDRDDVRGEKALLFFFLTVIDSRPERKVRDSEERVKERTGMCNCKGYLHGIVGICAEALPLYLSVRKFF